MSRAIVDAELEIYEPGNTGSTPDSTIPSFDLDHAKLSTRIQHSRDQGKITVDNEAGAYSPDVDIGDRVIFRTRLEGEGSLSDRWTGLIRDLRFRVDGPLENEMTITADDFVFGVLSIRYATFFFDNIQIAGTSSSIVNKLINDNASEIGTGQISTVSEKTDYDLRRTNLLEAFNDLTKKAEVLMASDGVDLVLKPKSDPSSKWTFASKDREGEWGSGLSDDEMVNDAVIDGGNDTALDVEQTAADSFQTVTESTRATQVVNVRKSDIARVELDIAPTGSGEAVIVRLQKNDGSDNPVDASDRTSDLARTRLESGDLIDGFNKFRFDTNDVPDPNPVIIVESDGTTGQDVAFDSGTGDLAYKVYYRFPVIAAADDNASISEYRRHEGRYRRESITSLEEAEQLAPRLVGKHRDPKTNVPFEAASDRAFNLSPAEVIDVNEPDVKAVGEYVVAEITDEYTSGRETRLTRNVTLQERTTI